MDSARNPQQWQYSWEALSHIKTLRLYLFHHSISPQAQCFQLAASLSPPDAHFNGLSILIKWAEPNTHYGHSPSMSLRVPVPPVVLDHSVPIQVKAVSDHIEVKLMLMLPVDHPLVESLSSLLRTSDEACEKEQQEECSSFSLDNDTRVLASRGEIHFHCNNCSAKLTKEPLRSFKELPSVDWREVADNWFGTCCCSFGGVSESLVANFEKFSSISKGTCFVGSTSITLHTDELARVAIIEHIPQVAQSNDGVFAFSEKQNNLCEKSTSVDDTQSHCDAKDAFLLQNSKYTFEQGCEVLPRHNVEKINSLLKTQENVGEVLEGRDRNRNNHISVSGSLIDPVKSENARTVYDQGSETMVCTEKSEIRISLPSDSAALSLKTRDSLGSAADFSLQLLGDQLTQLSTLGDPIENFRDKCCTADPGCIPSSQHAFGINSSLHCCDGKDSKNVSFQDKQLGLTSESRLESKKTISCYLGNGFMMGPSGVSTTVKWVALHCSACLSLVGSYPDVEGKPVSVDESIQLFKCHISTSETVGGPYDVFRKHTLQRIFVNQLQARAEDESSYRTVVRDLKTKSPMLQMVLLNATAWFCSGDCWERVLPGEEAAVNTDVMGEERALLVDDGYRRSDGINSNASVVTSASTIRRYSRTNLEPLVKVLFRDCSSCTKGELRAINDWTIQKHAEDIYMLGEEIKALTQVLESMKLRLPASCSSLQGFYLSFLEK